MDLKQLRRRGALCGAALLVAALLAFTAAYLAHYLRPSAAGGVTDLSSGWTYWTDGDPTPRTMERIRKVPEVSPDETLYLSRLLDDALPACLMVKFYYQELAVLLNGELLWQSPPPPDWTRNPGTGTRLIPLSDQDSGKTLTLALRSPYPVYTGYFMPILLGSAEALQARVFAEAVPHLFMLFLCVLLGGFFIFYSAFAILRGQNSWDSFFFGLFSVLLGFFIISRDNLIYLLFDPVPASLVAIGLHTVYLIPLMAFLYCFFTAHRRLVRCVLLLLCLNAAVVYTLQLTGIADMPSLVMSINISFAAAALPIVGMAIYEFIHRNPLIRFLSPLIALIVLCSVGTVVFYFDRHTPAEALYLNSVFLMAVGIWVYYVRQFILRRAEERRELQTLQLRNELTRQSYEGVLQRMEEARAQRHELRHHVAALQLLSSQGDSGRLNAYLDDLGQELERTQLLYSKNPLVDCILSECARHAQGAGIRVSFSVQVPETLPVADIDLCSLLANTLDNAVEGCLALPPDGERRLSLRLTWKAPFLALSCSNTCPPERRVVNGRIASTKQEDGHGYGIPIMRSISKKYGGLLELSSQDGCFQVRTMLQASRSE